MTGRLVVEVAETTFEVVESDDVFFLEAEGARARVRLRGRRTRLDRRSLGELEQLLAQRGFFRIHRSFLVNLGRVRLVQRRDGRRDWEVQLDPPVNRLLPVGRGRLKGLLRALRDS